MKTDIEKWYRDLPSYPNSKRTWTVSPEEVQDLTDKVREEGWKEGFEYARLTDFGEGNIGEVKKFLEEKGYKHLAKALTNNH